VETASLLVMKFVMMATSYPMMVAPKIVLKSNKVSTVNWMRATRPFAVLFVEMGSRHQMKNVMIKTY